MPPPSIQIAFFGLCLLVSAPVASADDDLMDWWSLKPLVRPTLPDGDGGSAPAATPIDQFIAAKQAEHGLSMSPEADRGTLVRRVYFDLIGLPPSIEEVEAFASDSSPDAYRKLVEKLLVSPRYGERWARHWLDVVHYGDTHGYDKDKLRPNAYPYRDYVIRAFNEDKNYSRFIQEQLAGDALFPDSSDAIVATGFIAAGPWDFIGHAEVSEDKIDGKIARHLDRDDMVATTMNALCAFTVQCAQCHDHKRDPVSMQDYYSLQAVFAALDRADRPYDTDPQIAEQRAQLTAEKSSLEALVAAQQQRISDAKSPDLLDLEKQIAALHSAEQASKGEPRSDRLGYHSQVATEQQTTKWVQIDLGQPVPIGQLVIAPADEYGFSDFGFPHRFKIEFADDETFTAPRTLVDQTGSDYDRPGSELIVLDPEQEGTTARYVRFTATKLWNRRQNGEPKTNDWIFALGEMGVIADGRLVPVKAVQALDSIEALPRWGKEDLVDGVYGTHTPSAEALLANVQKSAEGHASEIKALEARRTSMIATLDPTLLERAEALQGSLAQITARLDALPAPKMVYAGTIHSGSGTFRGTGHDGGKPRKISVLARGDVTQPLEEIGPGTLPFIPGIPARFPLTDGHDEADGRIALAEWITDRDNPLTWRTMVNRVWLYHFGRGIVDSPNDFGHMGQVPTHPELLDWLAVEFRDGGQSIKDLHRLILNSATYKQSSRSIPAAAEIDGGNQFLWRSNPRKLEAEALHDTILQVSGKLDTTMYGPGYFDFVLEKTEHSPHYEYNKHDPDDPKSHRRSIYRFLVRSHPAPFMDTLDCADPSLLVDKRNETLTVLQALALMNNRFVVRMSEHFAERLEAEADPIARAIELTLSRRAEPQELEALRGYAQQHGLAAACRIIFNTNEFAFAD